MTVFVISKNGERLMPTIRYGKVRHLLKEGKAIMYSRKPFVIQLTYDVTPHNQPIEICVDTGYEHVGVSVKSESREYMSAQYDLLPDEKKKHDTQSKNRRNRRNRKRYRKARFDNRRASKKPGWVAPSLKNKADRHVDIIKRIVAAAPVTNVAVEMGEFDTQVLKAMTEGKPIPEGKDYQHGPRYGIETLRAAVFHRDDHKCLFCGRGIDDGAVLHVHHAYFWRGQHGDSLDELATCCEKCHTSANHKPGGKLWGYDKNLPRYAGAAFMNTVRWYIYNQIKGQISGTEVHITYGAATKLARKEYGVEKSHTNDAYAMGNFHPAARAKTEYFKKKRRNNRVLEKFYDAQYIDTRDGERKRAAALGCERTKRKELRMSEKNLRGFRGEKRSKGRRRVRQQRYSIRSGDRLLVASQPRISKGIQNKGTVVSLLGKPGWKNTAAVKNVQVIYHTGGWEKIPAPKLKTKPKKNR